MPTKHRLPVHLFVFYLLFAVPLVFLHFPLLKLPYFWDEHGQFIPTALDLLRHGWWVAKSTVPNVHPPGVEVYLVLWYKLFGYSIPVTRMAMLLLAAGGLLATFLLAIDLSRGTRGAPAFWAPLLLIASPLFYTQSFMAQLDMPAMVFTTLALLFFIEGKYWQSSVACTILVLLKETGLVTPFVFFLFLSLRRDRRALLFVSPAIALSIWLVVLHSKTGYWLGDPGFAHYNVAYSLHPVRIALTLLRRLYYLFVAEFRWIGTIVLLLAFRRTRLFESPEWRVAGVIFAANVLLVSLLGGAELERYVLPVFPLLYAAFGVAFTALSARWMRAAAASVLIAGLAASLFWNPPYPFAFENNYAMVDFVRLQQVAAQFIERDLPDARVATAWPYSAGLRSPDFGFVDRKLNVVETNDFHFASVEAIPPSKYNVLVVYTRTWEPQNGFLAFPAIRSFLARFYQWEPAITAAQCEALGLQERASWSLHGQSIAVYAR